MQCDKDHDGESEFDRGVAPDPDKRIRRASGDMQGSLVIWMNVAVSGPVAAITYFYEKNT